MSYVNRVYLLMLICSTRHSGMLWKMVVGICCIRENGH